MNTRHICPGCKDKTFTFYIDTETGEHLSPDVGRCNHESKCSYHYSPKQYFQDNNIDTPQPMAYSRPKIVTPEQKPVSFIPVEIFKASLGSDQPNHFIKFLTGLFGVEVTNELICKYFIGTSKHWNGSTVFWQIDARGKVRTGKIMLYSPATGKRVKIPFDFITWVHSVLKITGFNLGQCMFGEHLLQDNAKPVAIVESEKTAIIASVYLPQFIWLSVGSLTNLNADKCSILKGRTVTLFPDLKGFDKWSAKAKEIAHITAFNISDLLECKASEAERQQGFDLADYLIKFDYRAFALPMPAEPPQPRQPIQTDQLPADTWNIAELSAFFAALAPIPVEPIQLNQCTLIGDVQRFIDTSLTRCIAGNGSRSAKPAYERLVQLKTMLCEREECARK